MIESGVFEHDKISKANFSKLKMAQCHFYLKKKEQVKLQPKGRGTRNWNNFCTENLKEVFLYSFS